MGRPRIDWKLITDLPVGNHHAAVEKLQWYAMRWKIEVFHKILKSGCRAEQARLRTAERLVRLIALFCILSWRVFWLTMLNRVEPNLEPALVLSKLETSILDRLMPNPAHDPANLLKLYLYGYLNRVRSSRRLEAESKRNLEVIWLLRRLLPDFKTIADFRQINRAAFRQAFREFVRLCRELELFGRELVAVDGTRIKAVNRRERNFTKAKLARALAESDERLSRISTGLTRPTGKTRAAPAAARWRISRRRLRRSKGGVSGLSDSATRWLRVAKTSSL